MIRRVVFLDRASLKATVRSPVGAGAYVEYDKTSPEEIVPRLAGAAGLLRQYFCAAATPLPGSIFTPTSSIAISAPAIAPSSMSSLRSPK